jgi:hypothetical protein
VRRRGQFAKDAIFATDELFSFGKFIIGPSKRVVAKPLAIRLISGEILDVVIASLLRLLCCGTIS